MSTTPSRYPLHRFLSNTGSPAPTLQEKVTRALSYHGTLKRVELTPTILSDTYDALVAQHEELKKIIGDATQSMPKTRRKDYNHAETDFVWFNQAFGATACIIPILASKESPSAEEWRCFLSSLKSCRKELKLLNDTIASSRSSLGVIRSNSAIRHLEEMDDLLSGLGAACPNAAYTTR